ncbi:GMC family oxidoreductase [Sphingobacterium daejeonense]|uniref:Alcohol oxidase n=1 Tax=Sphingobacterium daejeonense TaxID=371142 RepID=A0ABF7PQ19_9SPHI|nr:GMC family oxidoreductase N-terminal domain-containing protein [Sphingobacterium daejeonense]VTP91508.1 Alcohol dehydrogenase [acceptor] [Sphingobacterium daejeonense]
MKKFDFIIVGAGTAGPVIASRLTEKEHINVLLLEAGGENTNELSRIPGAFFKVLGTDYDWTYSSVEQTGLNNRSIYSPSGKVVGGSSAINVGVWVRGTKEDYDSWEAQGAKGWNFSKALEMFQKIEQTNLGPSKYHGDKGKVKLTDSSYPTPFVHTLLNGFKEAGFGEIGDYAGENPYSIDIMQKIYENNTRRTPADSYLTEDVRARENLTIITHAFVRKVLFEGTKAIGVEVEIDGQIQNMYASKEIILSAGTFNTPKLLKLSGVGPREELEKFGIPVIANVPGVGENLNDHLMFTLKFVSEKNIEDSIFNPLSDEAIDQWYKNKTGPSSYYPGVASGFVSSDGTKTGADFELIFTYTHGADGTEKEFANIEDIQAQSGYSVTVILLQPKSRGQLLLASTNPYDAPLINPRYFSDSSDMERFIKGVRYTQKITKTESLEPYTYLAHPALDATDEIIESLIRNEASTVFHPVGTARMGDVENDSLAVVDSSLKVRGIQGLRVADASIIPAVNRGHTMAPVVYVGEMASEIIINDN